MKNIFILFSLLAIGNFSPLSLVGKKIHGKKKGRKKTRNRRRIVGLKKHIKSKKRRQKYIFKTEKEALAIGPRGHRNAEKLQKKFQKSQKNIKEIKDIIKNYEKERYQDKNVDEKPLVLMGEDIFLSLYSEIDETKSLSMSLKQSLKNQLNIAAQLEDLKKINMKKLLADYNKLENKNNRYSQDDDDDDDDENKGDKKKEKTMKKKLEKEILKNKEYGQKNKKFLEDLGKEEKNIKNNTKLIIKEFIKKLKKNEDNAHKGKSTIHNDQNSIRQVIKQLKIVYFHGIDNLSSYDDYYFLSHSQEEKENNNYFLFFILLEKSHYSKNTDEKNKKTYISFDKKSSEELKLKFNKIIFFLQQINYLFNLLDKIEDEIKKYIDYPQKNILEEEQKKSLEKNIKDLEEFVKDNSPFDNLKNIATIEAHIESSKNTIKNTITGIKNIMGEESTTKAQNIKDNIVAIKKNKENLLKTAERIYESMKKEFFEALDSGKEIENIASLNNSLGLRKDFLDVVKKVFND